MTDKTEAAPQASIELTVNDLAALREIINIASQRGAFQAAELEAVGKAYNKLNSFIETVIASQKSQDTEEE